ncbi:MAG: CDP-alcohol phosphatidyltransferase family protein [Alphaproteobacteria bacterium]|nr:CDP-alcohol phosphatidyltransferase family protein [Alphaproteobacteria bacterium]
MFDRLALRLTKPVVDATARQLAKRGISANQVTFACFALGLASAVLIAAAWFKVGLVFLLLGRICDGLDGAVARQTQQTDQGAYLDVSLDFLFYAAVPLAFALANPLQNALAAAVLLAAFIGTGTSFLAYAILAEKRGEKNTAYPQKSFYYLGGLTEGLETIAAFMLMCLWPEYFVIFAYVYAAMCAVTTLTRIMAGYENFRP